MLRIGVIGCGKITAVRHAPEYAENPRCELTAWYDFDPSRAQALADQYGGRVCGSIEELLQSGVDAVSVCVANCDHASVTIRALEAGCHALCEKPMAVTPEECAAMAAAADRTGRRLLLGHNQRLTRTHQEARRLIAAGAIGRILAFHTTFSHPGPEGWTGQKNSWFYNKAMVGMGALGDLGIHKTDLLHYLLGEPFTSVSAAIDTLHKRLPTGERIPVDDNAMCLCRTQSGVMGQLHVSWTNYGSEDNSTRLYGTEGVMRLYDDPQYSLIIEHHDGEPTKLRLDEITTNKDQTDGNRTSTGVIDEFVHAVLTGASSVMDAGEAIKAMRVIFAAQQSALEARTVSVVHPD